MVQSTRLIAAGTMVLFCQSCITPVVREDRQEARDSVDEVASPPSADFESWLSAQCPDGRLLNLSNVETGELVADLPCEEVRAALLADASTREKWASVFVGQLQEPGVAREPLWSPIGWLCGVVFAFAVGYACERSHFDWKTCGLLSATPGLACAIVF